LGLPPDLQPLGVRTSISIPYLGSWMPELLR
jgi:hypothetical protein